MANPEKNHLKWFMHAVGHCAQQTSMKSPATGSHDTANCEPCTTMARRHSSRSVTQALVKLLFPELLPLP